MPEGAVLYELRDGIAWITLNRPNAMNAINREVTAGLAWAWQEFRKNKEARVAVLTGAGNRAFCAGGDVKERVAIGDPFEARWAQGSTGGDLNFGGPGGAKPTVAAINGHCLGGGVELALTCDIRIASPNATFGFPQVQRGSHQGGVGIALLGRTLPMSSAMEILLIGDPFGANEALRLGIINRIVAEGSLLEEAELLAQRIIKNDPANVEATKELVLRAAELPLDQWRRLSELYGALVDGHRTTPDTER